MPTGVSASQSPRLTHVDVNNTPVKSSWRPLPSLWASRCSSLHRTCPLSCLRLRRPRLSLPARVHPLPALSLSGHAHPHAPCPPGGQESTFCVAPAGVPRALNSTWRAHQHAWSTRVQKGRPPHACLSPLLCLGSEPPSAAEVARRTPSPGCSRRAPVRCAPGSARPRSPDKVWSSLAQHTLASGLLPPGPLLPRSHQEPLQPSKCHPFRAAPDP